MPEKTEAEIIAAFLDSVCESCGRKFNYELTYGSVQSSPVLCTPCLWSGDDE